jgi:hypothetical protein
MPTLEVLAQLLGGTVQGSGSRRWLDTTFAQLRTAVIERRGLITQATMHDLAMFMPASRELDPFAVRRDTWQLHGKDVLPRLRQGYVFAGCHAGVLFAAALAPPSLEQIVGTLWELADLAREPWSPLRRAPPETKWARRWRAWRDRLPTLGFVAIVVAVVLLLRR